MKLHLGSHTGGLLLVAAFSLAILFISPRALSAIPHQNQPVFIQAAPVAPVAIKSYREWKWAMINDAENRVKALKENLARSRQGTTEAGLNPNLQYIQDLLEKEQLQLSLAKEMTISDYFVGYLTKQKALGVAIKEVSGRLSPDEVAELMTAYANNFFASTPRSAAHSPRADSGQ